MHPYHHHCNRRLSLRPVVPPALDAHQTRLSTVSESRCFDLVFSEWILIVLVSDDPNRWIVCQIKAVLKTKQIGHVEMFLACLDFFSVGGSHSSAA
jgi:hypothetical protein